MVTVKDIYEELEKFAPTDRKMDFDNIGLLVGSSENTVEKIMLSLDITDEVISEAVLARANLIISHHPLFFELKNITDEDVTGRKIIRLISGGISAICMHTNLDAAQYGVSDALARAAGVVDAQLLSEDGYDKVGEPYSYGRMGYLAKPITLKEYLPVLKNALGSEGLRYHDAGHPVHKVAMVSGSGGDWLCHAAAHGCDTFITADVKYDVFLEAKALGINIIDGDHFCTENLVIPVLEKLITESFPDTETMISKVHGQIARFA